MKAGAGDERLSHKERDAAAKQAKWEMRQALREARAANRMAEEQQRRFDTLKKDETYMAEAIKLAEKAMKAGEVPIGCVIVKDDQIIGKGYNRRTALKSVFGHAEMEAIKEASKIVGDWRLENCVMYVTLEPCQMCAGAVIQSRIPRVVIGARNMKAGSCGSIIDLFHVQKFNHQVHTVFGVCEKESGALLEEFFRTLRERKDNDKGT